MKKLSVVLIIIVAVIIGIVVVKDQIVKTVITTVATGITGAPVRIQKFTLRFIKQSVKIEGFTMGNPKGFSAATIVDLPKVEVALNSAALLKGKVHVRLVDIDLKELGLEKNKEGKLNVNSLKVAQRPEKEPKPHEKKKETKVPPFQIDELNLQMGRMVMKDYSAGTPPMVKVFDLNVKKSYKNITSVQQLAALILSEPMKSAGFKGAGIYGAAMLTGVGIVPVVAIAALTGKDVVKKEFNLGFDKLYAVSLEVLKAMGEVNRENSAQGEIAAEVSGAGVTLKLRKISENATEVAVSARKLMLPKPEIANGVLYQISEKTK